MLTKLCIYCIYKYIQYICDAFKHIAYDVSISVASTLIVNIPNIKNRRLCYDKSEQCVKGISSI